MPNSAAQSWLEKSAEDERVVSVLKRAGGPWSAAAYHVQQAAEKAIKSVLVQSGVAPPKSHDLMQLLSLLAIAAPADVETAAAMLSAYAWLTRYPGGPAINETDVLTAESNLVSIKAWAATRLP